MFALWTRFHRYETHCSFHHKSALHNICALVTSPVVLLLLKWRQKLVESFEIVTDPFVPYFSSFETGKKSKTSRNNLELLLRSNKENLPLKGAPRYGSNSEEPKEEVGRNESESF